MNHYKYNPDDYRDIMSMYEEMVDFYKQLEIYQEHSTLSNKYALIKQLHDFLFTIKHRELEGYLTHHTATEIREYIRGLVDD